MLISLAVMSLTYTKVKSKRVYVFFYKSKGNKFAYGKTICQMRNIVSIYSETSINSLWPSDAIRRQGTESTLAQVMVCCLTAASHYLNQCWLIISKVPRHSSEGIIMRRSEDTNLQTKIENYIFRIAFRSPRDQWVKQLATWGEPPQSTLIPRRV